MDRLSMNENLVRVVLCTVPPNNVEELVNELLESRAAACVSAIDQVRSTYRWKEKVERAQETQLIIKTSSSTLPRLLALLESIHPYDVPEILVLDGASSRAYREWVVAETGI